MIASVTGTVQSRRPDHVVIDCGGVGYRLSVSSQTLEKVPAAGRETSLLGHLILRDDGIQLYGFATEAERELFLRLISVAGVGPKMALAALSASTAAELRKAIATSDAKRFQIVPGIGRKTAERVIVELREVMAAELAGDDGSTGGSDDARSLAREGLAGLGYDPAEAEAMLEAALAESEPGSSPEVLIQTALRARVKAA
jgi:holliday junction DNA helicase RuvA